MLKLEDLTGGRFVLLRHDHPILHWDFLLEHHSSAATWRLLTVPDLDRPISAERIPDHRLHYLTYEGPVSGDRGRVSRFASGTYVVNKPPFIQSSQTDAPFQDQSQAQRQLTIIMDSAQSKDCDGFVGQLRGELILQEYESVWSFERLATEHSATPG